MLRSSATDITIGSITVEPRSGNPGSVYHLENDGTSINSLGLPNPGLQATKAVAHEMMRKAVEAGKKICFSVAGFSRREYAKLCSELKPFGLIELNLGCPNVWGEDGQKPIASFNLDLLDDILEDVSQLYDTGVGYGYRVKLSPYSDPLMIQAVADVLKLYKECIEEVVICNTFPCGIAFAEDGSDAINPGGYGGVAGNGLHLIALGQVAQFTQALQGTGIGVIGVGGINSGSRVLNMRKAGACGVQIGTHFYENDGRIFSELFQTLPESAFLLE